MTREELIKEFRKRMIKWLDKKSTGMLNVEVHANQGGISEVHFLVKDTLSTKTTSY